MVKNLLLGIAAALLASLSAIAIASAELEEVDPFERLVSVCGGWTLLYRVTEDSPIRFNLEPSVYGARLWTQNEDYNPTHLELWGFGYDGNKKRSFSLPWNNISDNDTVDQRGHFVNAFAAPGGTVIYYLQGSPPIDYVLEIFSYDDCTAPIEEQSDEPRDANEDTGREDSPAPRPLSNYEPVVSDWQWTDASETLGYMAQEDAFTDRVRTDVRLRGPSGHLTLDAVCFDSGRAALGFRLNEFSRLERDTEFPDRLEVIWRLNDEFVQRRTLDVEFLGETPAVYFTDTEAGFGSDWPQIFGGGTLAVRINYRGVQEDTFDLDLFRETPVHDNLVHCGNY